ncbi:MAG: hypothetical protein ACYC75_01080 [Minisyncoccota bacterium]
MSSRIIPLVALMIAIGLFLAYVNPTWTGPIAAAKAAIASDDEALTAAAAYAKQQGDLTQARDAIAPADLARLATFLPGSVDNVGLILDLNALAARSGISLSNINVASDSSSAGSASQGASMSAQGSDPIGSIDISLSAVGTYSALKTFLNGVEKSERLLDVEDLAMTGSDTGVYTYQIKLRIYWLR